MKLEDLKNCEIITGEGVDIFLMNKDDIVSTVFYETAYDFDDQQNALLAAARFRASEEMYQALTMLLEGIRGLPPLTAIAGSLEAQYKRATAALALADNTNETLPL